MRIAAVRRKELERALSSVASAEHHGEADEGLRRICKALDLPTPQWSNRRGRTIFAWGLERYQQESEALGEALIPEFYDPSTTSI